MISAEMAATTSTPAKMAIHIHNEEELKTKLTEAGNKLVVIDLFATWCGPCMRIAPVVENIASTNSQNVVVLKVDIDECSDIADHYGVVSIPCFVFIKNSTKLESFEGANEKMLLETVDRLIKAAPPKPAPAQTPAVQTPAVQTPAAQMPAVQTPAVQTPAVQTPVRTPVQTPNEKKANNK